MGRGERERESFDNTKLGADLSIKLVDACESSRDLLTMELVHQLNSVDSETYQSLLPQPCVRQFGLI